MKKVVINKNDLVGNIEVAKKLAGKDTSIIAVVKGNGCGLDIIKLSRVLNDNGINILAVATTEEAIMLREAGFSCKILMLTPVNNKHELIKLVDNDITLTIGSLKNIELLKSISLDDKIIDIHIKIDTGFARYGFDPNDAQEIIKEIKKVEFLNIEGIYTHFSYATDSKTTHKQFEMFKNVVKVFEDEGITFKYRHCSETTAFIKYPEMNMDAVRLGSFFQGRTMEKVDGLKPIGKVITEVNEIKELKKGSTVSYRNTYKTKKDSKVAILPIGYEDGYNRVLARDDFSLKNNIAAVWFEIRKLFKDNRLKVKIGNEEFRVIGKIGMYHTVVDISDAKDNIKVGDEVELCLKPLNTNCSIRREYL